MKRAKPPTGRSREVDRIARRLRATRRELLAECEQCRTELQSAADGDSADEDAAAQTYSSVADILYHLLREIREVEEALERLESGEYGRCAECGLPITADRLKAMPTARRCLKCQIRSERWAG